ncbi:MAG: DsbA family oxidoreductase [Chloroflexi bacterium]|nr:DsbA family oxidoreductase [Chloroflexota bacterium]
MRAERLLQEFSMQLEAWAYDLRPNLPPQGLPRDQAYPGRSYPQGYLDHLRQTAAEARIDMQRPAIVANTRKAHEATEFAADQGCLLEFQRAVFHAYWEEDQNISDIDVLCRLAAGCGLDAAALRQALDEGRYAARIEEQMAWARAAGVNGVPTFIFNDKFAVVGAQEYDVFRDVASRIVSGEIKG